MKYYVRLEGLTNTRKKEYIIILNNSRETASHLAQLSYFNILSYDLTTIKTERKQLKTLGDTGNISWKMNGMGYSTILVGKGMQGIN